MSTPGTMRAAERIRAAYKVPKSLPKKMAVKSDKIIAEIIDNETHATEMLEYLEAVIESFDADGGIMLFNLMPGFNS